MLSLINKMDVSIGVMAYNEEQNIDYLIKALLKQKTKKINIKEIIIVSSGSTDNTNKIVKKNSNKKVKLVIEKERRGKSHAINLFLKKAKSNILVLESADTIPKKETIEQLCLPLIEKNVGIVGGKSIPKNRNNFFKKNSEIIWDLHDIIAKQKPKFGELIAFKKIMKQIPETIVDEEEIASIIQKNKFKLIYEPKAIINNKGPENLIDLIKQRRRVYCGHLKLKRQTGYSASTINNFFLLKVILKYIINNPKQIIYFFITCKLEMISRFLGWFDFKTNKNHFIWNISTTTKQLK